MEGPNENRNFNRHHWLISYLDWNIRRYGRFLHRTTLEELIEKEFGKRYPNPELGDISAWYKDISWSPLKMLGLGTSSLPLHELEIWAFDPSKERIPKCKKSSYHEDDLIWKLPIHTPILFSSLSNWVVPRLDVGTIDELEKTTDYYLVPLWGNKVNPEDKIHVLASGLCSSLFFTMAGHPGREESVSSYKWRMKESIRDIFKTRHFRETFNVWFENSLSEHLPAGVKRRDCSPFFELFEGNFYLGYVKGYMVVAGNIRYI